MWKLLISTLFNDVKMAYKYYEKVEPFLWRYVLGMEYKCNDISAISSYEFDI